MSDTVSQSIKVFDQLYTDSESNETKPITEKLSFIIFSTPVLTKVFTWWVSYMTFEIYFPECLLSRVLMSERRILVATFFCSSPATSSPTLMIFNLAK